MKNPLSIFRFLSLRPAHWSILGFRFVPLLLFAAGTCAVIYGGFYHRLPVMESHDEEITVAEPVEPQMPLGMGVGAPFGPPGMGPGSPFGPPDMGNEMPPEGTPGAPPEHLPPPVKFVTRIKTIETTFNELEWNINILITGMTGQSIVRNEKGNLERRGSETEGPAFCPT